MLPIPNPARGALMASVLLLGACASPPPRPTEELAAADMAVEQAEASLAPTFAPSQLEQAREKRNRADEAAEAENTVRARRLAEQAVVDARLAEATADAAIAAQSLDEMEASLAALREATLATGQPLTN
jgi:hypothetical protein